MFVINLNFLKPTIFSGSLSGIKNIENLNIANNINIQVQNLLHYKKKKIKYKYVRYLDEQKLPFYVLVTCIKTN